MNALHRSVVALVGLSLLAGCTNTPWSKKDDDAKIKSSSTMKNTSVAMAMAKIHASGAASTQPANTNVSGTVTFTQAGDAVRVAINLTGFAPNSTHGFHIHEKGDLSDPGLMSAGPHFNPEKHKHGGPDSPMSHAGDFGNITSDANGNVNTEMTVHGITLDSSKLGILGRSVVVHAKADDLMSDPAGNSGTRIAGGVIEAAK